MKGQFRIINSRESLELAIQQLRDEWESNKWLMMQTTNEKQRSQLQNNSLHLWLTLVASALNEQGLDVRQVLAKSKRQDIPWTMAACKEHLWKPVQLAYNGKNSTTKASTTDYSVISDILNRTFGEQFGVYVPWPDRNRVAA